MYHVTNGDSAAALIRESGLPGAANVVPWRDVLHEGPVPGGLSDAELARVRAEFIAASGWAPDPKVVLAELQERDAILERWLDAGEVVLWFEHDLYDQVQLLQILDRVARRPAPGRSLALICVDRFPGVDPFYGMGQLRPEQLATLWPDRRPVGPDQIALGARGWAAFTSASPAALPLFSVENLSPLPFLGPALRRFAEEAPSLRDGLSRTERQILLAVRDGAHRPPDIFQSVQRLEEAPFQGDLTVWTRIRDLSRERVPLLQAEPDGEFALPLQCPQKFAEQSVTLTPAGRDVLEGRANRTALDGFDRWLGGQHLVIAPDDAPGTNGR